MAITFVAAATNADAALATATNISVSVPTGTVDDDFMIKFAFKNEDAGGISLPSGWTNDAALSTQSAAGSDRENILHFRKASSEPASYDIQHTTGTTQAFSVAILTFRGVDTTTPFDVVPTSSHIATPGNTDNPSNPAITTVTDGAMVILLHGCVDFSTPWSATGPPSLYAESHGEISAVTAGQAGAYRIITTAALETPGAWTHTNQNNDSIILTLALRPAAGGAPEEFLGRQYPQGVSRGVTRGVV